MPRDYKVSLEDMLASAMRIHSLTSSLVLVFVSTVADFHGRDCFVVSLLAMTFPLPVIASAAKQSSSVPSSASAYL